MKKWLFKSQNVASSSNNISMPLFPPFFSPPHLQSRRDNLGFFGGGRRDRAVIRACHDAAPRPRVVVLWPPPPPPSMSCQISEARGTPCHANSHRALPSLSLSLSLSLSIPPTLSLPLSLSLPPHVSLSLSPSPPVQRPISAIPSCRVNHRLLRSPNSFSVTSSLSLSAGLVARDCCQT